MIMEKTTVYELTPKDVAFYPSGGNWQKHRMQHTFYRALLGKNRQLWLARDGHCKKYQRQKFIEDHFLGVIHIAYRCDKDGKLWVMEKDEIVNKISEQLAIRQKKRKPRKKGAGKQVSVSTKEHAHKDGEVDVDGDVDDFSEFLASYKKEAADDMPTEDDVIPMPPKLTHTVSVEVDSAKSASVDAASHETENEWFFNGIKVAPDVPNARSGMPEAMAQPKQEISVGQVSSSPFEQMDLSAMSGANLHGGDVPDDVTPMPQELIHTVSMEVDSAQSASVDAASHERENEWFCNGIKVAPAAPSARSGMPEVMFQQQKQEISAGQVSLSPFEHMDLSAMSGANLRGEEMAAVSGFFDDAQPGGQSVMATLFDDDEMLLPDLMSYLGSGDISIASSV